MGDDNLLRHLILALARDHGHLEAVALGAAVTAALSYRLTPSETASARQLGRAIGAHLMAHAPDESVEVLDGLLDLVRRLDGARAVVVDFDAWRQARAAGLEKRDADALASAAATEDAP